MALEKADHQLEQVNFLFAEDGSVSDVVLLVNYAVREEGGVTDLTRIRETKSAWGDMTASEKSVADRVGKRLSELAKVV